MPRRTSTPARRTAPKPASPKPASPEVASPGDLADLPLSLRARDWLVSIGVTRKRAPRDPKLVRAAVKKLGGPSWPVLLAVEKTFGGLEGRSRDARVFSIGAAHRFGKPIRRDGELFALVGGYDPVSWLVRRDGTIVEIDEVGVHFFGADSLTKRIEQLSIERPGSRFGRLDGRKGAALAKKLGLPGIAAPTDSRQRYWGTGGASHVTDEGVLVCEHFAPAEYGSRERTWSTWIFAKTDDELRDALRSP